MSVPIVEITESDLPQNLKSFWNKAQEAVKIQNHGYAISLVNAVLKESPGFLEARKLARKCAAQLTAGTAMKKGGGFFGGMSTSKLVSAAKKDPAKGLIAIEKELEKAPFDASVNEALYDVAMSLGLLQTATFALETVRQGSPENAKILHKLALHYIQLERTDLATEVYTEIVKYHPGDSVAVKGAKDCAARASMKQQRWGEDADIESLKKDAAGAKALEDSDRAAMTKDQQVEKLAQLIEQYQQDQNNLNVVKSIAALYEEMENWTDAHAFYDWAYQISNSDTALKQKAAMLSDKVAKETLRVVEDQLAADPNNEELRAYVAEARRASAAEAVIVAKKRVEENPTDPQMRFDLGSALYDAGEYSEAIPHLQQATRNPHIRTKVLLTLARAFVGKGMLDLAVKQLSDALADLQVMDSTKKEVLYEKGLVHDKLGAQEEALNSFKQIYEIDYGYRDVAHRVESSYS